MRLGYMREIAEKSLSHTAHSIRTGLYDTPSVLMSAHTAKLLCERRRDYTELSRGVIRLVGQGTSLYCATLVAYENLPRATVQSREFFESSKSIAQRALMLFGSFGICENASDRLERIISLTAEIEGCLCDSRSLRFSILSRCGKIFYALPELEFVSACTEILSKSLRLSGLSLEVYNKFTLYT